MLSIQNNTSNLLRGQCFFTSGQFQQSHVYIPEEILMLIFDFADLSTLYALKYTNRSFEHLMISALNNKKIYFIFEKYIKFANRPLELHIVPALLHGNSELIKYMNNYMFDRYILDPLSLIYGAIENNQLNAFKAYLQDPRIDILDHGSASTILDSATIFNRLEMVQFLIKDKGCDPSACFNSAVSNASYNGHIEILKFLLEDERVDPSMLDNSLIQMTASKGHVKSIEILLKDKRVDPSQDNNFSLQMAIEAGHLEVSQILLDDPRVDLSINYKNVDAWREEAREKGHTEIVKLIDSKINTFSWKLKVTARCCLSLCSKFFEATRLLIRKMRMYIRSVIRKLILIP